MQKRINWTKENIINHIENKIGYTFLEFIEYNKCESIVKVKCTKGHVYEVSFNSIRRGKKCRECSGSKKHTYEWVKNYIQDNGYELLSDHYDNNKKHLILQCPKKHITKMRFDHFKKGTRCSKCKRSKGEELIEEFLLHNNIEYIREYTYEECKTSRLLPFDFYLPKYNCCIEFDGRQHYKISDTFNIGLLGLMNIKYRDDIKTNYCKNNNIKLIRIKYTEFPYTKEIICRELNVN